MADKKPDTNAYPFEQYITEARCKQTMIELIRVPSPQTELLEAEPLLRTFIETAVEPRLRAMGVNRIRYDAMGNLIAEIGEGASPKTMMMTMYAMTQPQATMKNAYAGDVIDGAPHGLPGEAVLGKGVSEQKAPMAAMLTALEALLKTGTPIKGKLYLLCLVAGETGRHDAISNVVEKEGIKADIAVMGGTSLRLSLGNRGRVDVYVTVNGFPGHSSKPSDACDAITGAMMLIGMLRDGLKLGAHPQLGPATMAVSHLRSYPDSTHTIQDRVELTIDRRLVPGDDPDAAVAEIAAIAKRLETMKDPASGRSWTVGVKKGPFMYPYLNTAESPAIRLILDTARDVANLDPEQFYSPSAFDQGYLNNHMGISTVNFGAAEYQFAHTDLDMASVQRTYVSARVYAHAIIRYLQ